MCARRWLWCRDRAGGAGRARRRRPLWPHRPARACRAAWRRRRGGAAARWRVRADHDDPTAFMKIENGEWRCLQRWRSRSGSRSSSRSAYSVAAQPQHATRSTTCYESMAMTTKIRVLIVDDQSLIRVGIQTLLSRKPDIEVVGYAGDGAEALRQVAALDPDVVLMDIRMPGMDGVEATRQLVARQARASIIILTTFHYDANVFSALAAGPRGYRLKDTDHKELAEAIRVASAGRARIHPEIR